MKKFLLSLLVFNFSLAHAQTSSTVNKDSRSLLDMINKTRIEYYEALDKQTLRPEEKLLKAVKNHLTKKKVDFNYVCQKDCGKLLYGTQSIISVAVQTKSQKLVQLLVDHGADLNFTAPGHLPPIMYLTQDRGFHDKSAWRDNGGSGKESFISMALFLLNHGANPNAFGTQEFPVNAITYWRNGKGVAMNSLPNEMKLNFIMQAMTYTLPACSAEEISGYRKLFSHPSMNLNLQNEYGLSALHFAMMKLACSEYAVKLLVESGADVYLRDDVGNTPADLYYVLKDHRDLERAAYEYLSRHH